MSEQYPPEEPAEDATFDPAYSAGGRRRGKKRRSLPGCLAALIAFAVLVGGAAFGVVMGLDFLDSRLSSAEDYNGPGYGRVLFEVQEGDSAADMGRALKEQGVIASVEAFTDAASAEPASRGIQVGFYQLKKEMRAEDALTVLIDPVNLIRNSVTIPEGLRVEEVVDILTKKTDFKRREFEQVLDNPAAIGLPDYAEGNAEGYLFPATYDLGPKDTPESILTAMVDRWRQAADDVDLEGAAEELGYSPHELMTVASLIQAEARGEYMPKVARVLYNRLETDGPPTYGLLQLDATVNYALDRQRSARTTEEDRQTESPYNTYLNTGLPPGPIESPGEEAMEAATAPADGPWFYYVTVNLRTGETKFAETLEEHNQNVEELNEYCRTQSKRC
jgi:UPF0755 protein